MCTILIGLYTCDFAYMVKLTAESAMCYHSIKHTKRREKYERKDLH